ncbi:hypothetical protein AB1Y20_010480 [Prymnesium parvum]|uniref:Uncharacterized protein n=1 Tax=Prymnesium parvum TaxID=97485 RepID=A0AB34ISD0_PRYPA
MEQLAPRECSPMDCGGPQQPLEGGSGMLAALREDCRGDCGKRLRLLLIGAGIMLAVRYGPSSWPSTPPLLEPQGRWVASGLPFGMRPSPPPTPPIPPPPRVPPATPPPSPLSPPPPPSPPIPPPCWPPPPLPTPPPSHPPPPSIADKINERFRNFRASSELSWEHFPAVIVHGMDHTEDPDEPYRVCSPHSPDCGFLSDRMSASIIWKDKGTATFGGGGFVLNPSYTRILCIYGGDGGTRGKLCKPPGTTPACIPGCKTSEIDHWCDPAKADSSWCDGKAWPPSQLKRMLLLDQGTSKPSSQALVILC